MERMERFWHRDHKQWVSDRADEIAQTKYKLSYSDLSDHFQQQVWSEAEHDYVDFYSAEIDNLTTQYSEFEKQIHSS
jgi:hypothetical protein